MEFTNSTVLYWNNFCRACLCESNSMIDMTKTVEDSTEPLFKIFMTVTNIEISSSGSLPLCLCMVCNEKLNSSYTFLRQCQQSNDILCRYASTQEPEIFDAANQLQPEEPVVEPNESLPINCMAQNVPNVKKRKRVSQPMRLVQVPISEITLAIEESRRSFVQNVCCIKCGFSASNSRALSTHISYVHTELKDRWCVYCNQEIDNLTAHINRHLTCRFCSKSFRSKSHLKEHLISHSGCRPYTCDVCKRGFLTERHLRGHAVIHSSEKPFICRFCKQNFDSLRDHLCKHKNEIMHSSDKTSIDHDANEGSENFCTICNNNVQSLSRHIKKIHSGIVDYKLCSTCGKQFKTTALLQSHMKMHQGDMLYECGSCGRRFRLRTHLILHVRTHTGEKPHVCHVCGKSFSQSGVLNTHLKIHTGRPAACKICGQKFCRPAQLHLHMRKHTGEKPYVCNECGQAFIQRSHLMQHEKIHSGERPYNCKYCDKSFKQSSTLKTHVNIHFGNKPYKCTSCTYACRQSYSLQVHMKKHLLPGEIKKSVQSQEL